MIMVLLPAYSQEIQNEDTSAWAKVEPAIKDYFKSINANCRYAEFRSDLLRKHLPDYRVYVRTDQHIMGQSTTFLVYKQGKVIDLGEGSWDIDTASEYSRVHRLTEFIKSQKIKVKNKEESIEVVRLVEDILAKCSRVLSVTEFIKSQKIKVKNTEEAIEIVRSVEDISDAYDYINFLKMNTNDYSIFDKRILEVAFGSRTYWNYNAETTKKGWIVKLEYIGPPADIMEPPVYEVDVDENKIFIDIRKDNLGGLLKPTMFK
jgi:hypothetical protein